MSLVFLLGGARSGKSSRAVELARAWDGPVTFLATGEAGDDEMADRIGRHRAERPAEWTTIEEPRDLRGAIARVDDGSALVVDCLSLWVANVLGRTDEEIADEARAAAVLAAARVPLTIAVSNEVGLGVVPASELGRRYRDVLGYVNAVWAAAAAEAHFVVAGRLLALQ